MPLHGQAPLPAGQQGQEQEEDRGAGHDAQGAPASAFFLGAAAFPFLLAGPDVFGQRVLNFRPPLFQPVQGFVQPAALEQQPGGLPLLAPARGLGPSPLLPAPEFAVLAHPFPQAGPVADEGFVGHFNVVRLCRATPARDHQTLVGQASRQGPPFLPQLLAMGPPAGVFRAFPGLHQLNEQTTGLRLFLGGQAVEDLLGMTNQRALHAADGLVGRVGQPAVFLALPELGEGEFQQGQVAGFVPHILQDAFHQARLKGHMGATGRFHDGPAQFLIAHGGHQEVVLPQGLVQPAAFGQEVHAHDQHQVQGCARLFPRVQEHVHIPPAHRAVGHQGEEFLELVHHQQELLASLLFQDAAHHIVQSHPARLQVVGKVVDFGEALHLGQVGFQQGDQNAGQFAEGVLGRARQGDGPAGQGADAGNQPGLHQGGLAATRSAQHHGQGIPPYPLGQFLAHFLAAKEIGRVLLAERLQAPVGIGRAGVFVQGGPEGHQLHHGDAEGGAGLPFPRGRDHQAHGGVQAVVPHRRAAEAPLHGEAGGTFGLHLHPSPVARGGQEHAFGPNALVVLFRKAAGPEGVLPHVLGQGKGHGAGLGGRFPLKAQGGQVGLGVATHHAGREEAPRGQEREIQAHGVPFAHHMGAGEHKALGRGQSTRAQNGPAGLVPDAYERGLVGGQRVAGSHHTPKSRERRENSNRRALCGFVGPMWETPEIHKKYTKARGMPYNCGCLHPFPAAKVGARIGIPMGGGS